MTPDLLLNDVALYSLQIGLLVGMAAFVPAALRLRSPKAKLAYWHILLAACLLLPLLAPKKHTVLTVSVRTLTGQRAPAAPGAPAPPPGLDFAATEIALAVLAAGALARLAWLGIGFLRLQRYRRHARPLVPSPSWAVEADLRLSEHVSSPVTFGARKPVVLLPAGFHELDVRIQDAILAHECLHVRRRDWLFTFAEEVVRGIFWFHPAIWWLLGEIQLAREQAVDSAAVEMTNEREQYVDALLAIAGAHPQLDLAPAPLFLRRRHLKQRVVSILKEVRMSKARLVSAFTAGLCILAAAAWIVTGAFPLAAAPQVVTDGPGITVDTGGATLLHRNGVNYPAEARGKGISGTVVVEVSLDSTGSVNDMRVVSGPDELRRAALQSILQWHFARDSAGKTRQVSVNFQAPEPQTLPGVLSSVPSEREAPPRTVRSIMVLGVPDSVRDRLLATLPVHVGDSMPQAELTQKVTAAVKQFDEHLQLGFGTAKNDDGISVIIGAPGSPARSVTGGVAGGGVVGGIVGGVPGGGASGGVLGGILSSRPEGSDMSDAPPAPPMRIRVGGNVQAANLLQKVEPVYPPLAKQARISGVVKLNVLVGKDGTVQNLSVESGHPLLVQAALDAVRQWVYRQTLLNGNPVEVQTVVDVNFALADQN